jgi:hypothetical protein
MHNALTSTFASGRGGGCRVYGGFLLGLAHPCVRCPVQGGAAHMARTLRFREPVPRRTALAQGMPRAALCSCPTQSLRLKVASVAAMRGREGARHHAVTAGTAAPRQPTSRTVVRPYPPVTQQSTHGTPAVHGGPGGYPADREHPKVSTWEDARGGGSARRRSEHPASGQSRSAPDGKDRGRSGVADAKATRSRVCRLHDFRTPGHPRGRSEQRPLVSERHAGDHHPFVPFVDICWSAGWWSEQGINL